MISDKLPADIAHKNICMLNIFGSKANRVLKNKLRTKKAQSMMQVLFKEMSVYATTDFEEILDE